MQEHERREHSANWHRWPALSPRAMGNDTALKIVLWQRQRACEGAGASRATVNTDAESANEDAQSAERVEQTNDTSRQTGRIALAVDKIHTVPRNGSRSTGKSSERGASRESLLSYDCSRRCLHSSKRNKRMLVSGVVERTTLHSCRIIEDADSISFVSIMKQIE